MTFTIAIVGRPNVGKSTLFNRLCGTRAAIVHDMPGVTRDRREGEGQLVDLKFRLMDTAGLEEADPNTIEGRMRAQTDAAIVEADVVLMLIDARAGVTPLDAHFGDLLRRLDKPVILVLNKYEGKSGDNGLYESYSLGLGEPVAISAEHNLGMADLFEAIKPYADKACGVNYEHANASNVDDEDAYQKDTTWAKDLDVDISADDDDDDDDDDDVIDVCPEDEGVNTKLEALLAARPLQLAIVGRPNVGKSTLFNTLIGEDRMLTGPEAGLTRDSIQVEWEWKGRPIRLVDTAGLRRKSKIDKSLEQLSTQDTLNTLRLANVVILVLDANAALEKQDLTIARYVVEEGRSLIVAVNKWDIAENRQEIIESLKEKLAHALPQVRGVPTVTISAIRGKGIKPLMDAVFEVYDLWNKRVPTRPLNDWLSDMTERHPPPIGGLGRRLRVRYITQAKIRPPTFVTFVSKPSDMPDSYARYLVNGLRDSFDLEGVPIRLHMRQGKNPYSSRKKRR